VKTRDARTMLGAIKKYIRPGSIIISDGWKAYAHIEELEEFYEHHVISHTEGFVNTYGAHTNAIEGKWRPLKAQVAKKSRKFSIISGPLRSEIWRHKNKDDLWDALLELISEMEYI